MQRSFNFETNQFSRQILWEILTRLDAALAAEAAAEELRARVEVTEAAAAASAAAATGAKGGGTGGEEQAALQRRLDAATAARDAAGVGAEELREQPEASDRECARLKKELAAQDKSSKRWACPPAGAGWAGGGWSCAKLEGRADEERVPR